MRFTNSIALLSFVSFLAAGEVRAGEPSEPALIGKRFLTLNTIVRVRQIEVTRDTPTDPMNPPSTHPPKPAPSARPS